MAESPAAAARPGAGGRTPLVPAAARAMAVFETFAAEGRALTKSELARLLDLPESSTSDLLNTLFELGYVARTPASRRFYPTARLVTVARVISDTDRIGAVAGEAATLVAARTRETAILVVADAAAIRVVGVAQGAHRLRYVVNIGDTFSLHGTGAGKALLGVLGPSERARVLRLAPLPPLTPHTVVDPQLLEAEVVEASERGWYAARDEGTVGVSSIATSGFIGTEPAALGIIGPTDRVAAQKHHLVAEVVDVGRQVFDG